MIMKQELKNWTSQQVDKLVIRAINDLDRNVSVIAFSGETLCTNYIVSNSENIKYSMIYL